MSVLQALEKMHCDIEPATDKIVGIDVLPEADINEVYRVLQEAERAGILEFEEGYWRVAQACSSLSVPLDNPRVAGGPGFQHSFCPSRQPEGAPSFAGEARLFFRASAQRVGYRMSRCRKDWFGFKTRVTGISSPAVVTAASHFLARHGGAISS